MSRRVSVTDPVTGPHPERPSRDDDLKRWQPAAEATPQTGSRMTRWRGVATWGSRIRRQSVATAVEQPAPAKRRSRGPKFECDLAGRAAVHAGGWSSHAGAEFRGESGRVLHWGCDDAYPHFPGNATTNGPPTTPPTSSWPTCVQPATKSNAACSHSSNSSTSPCPEHQDLADRVKPTMGTMGSGWLSLAQPGAPAASRRRRRQPPT